MHLAVQALREVDSSVSHDRRKRDFVELAQNDHESAAPRNGVLETGIDIDEFGDLIDPADLCRGQGVDPAPGCFVWTNTTVEGHVHINNGCLGLTTNNSIFADSTLGKITSVSGGWTNGKFFTCAIDTPRIYCFEQSTAEPIP